MPGCINKFAISFPKLSSLYAFYCPIYGVQLNLSMPYIMLTAKQDPNLHKQDSFTIKEKASETLFFLLSLHKLLAEWDDAQTEGNIFKYKEVNLIKLCELLYPTSTKPCSTKTIKNYLAPHCNFSGVHI